MSDAPDFIWAKTTLGNTDEGYWNDCPIVPNMAANQGTAYVRRDPAVLATLPEVQALIAATLEGVANNKEQLEIWAHEVVVGLGLADVLKITSYDDNIEAHDTVGRELVEIIRALIRPDAKAALDAHVAAEVRKALEGALALVRGRGVKGRVIYGDATIEAIDQAIRAMIPEVKP